MRTGGAPAWLALALAMGCAAGRPEAAAPGAGPALSPDEQSALMHDEETIRRAERDLYTPAAAPSAPDCARACDLVGVICTLGRRICTIADRHPDAAELGRRCSEDRERCDRARKHAAAAGCTSCPG